MSVTVITTLHNDGYNLYGSRNLKTWFSFFPDNWKIVYYAEKHEPAAHPRLAVLDFNKECPDWENFYQGVIKHLQNHSTPKDQKIINWHKKALRWSFKMFALLNAMKTVNSRYLMWLDADVFATRTPDAGWIEKCLDGNAMAAQLEFIKAGGHVETGILILDLHHQDISKIYDWISLGYVQQRILDEDKAWDGIWMAKLVQSKTVAWNNLNMVIQSNVARAFSNGRLTWLTHHVGKYKFKETGISARSGRSPEQELL